jgi:hypothetical protein
MKDTLEKHWRVQKVAADLAVSYQTVIRMFENDPRVRILGEQSSTRKRRRYRTLLIPDSVLQEYLNRLRAGGAPAGRIRRRD